LKSLGKVVLNKKLTKIVGKFNVEHKLIQEGDRVLVGLSGGKDSLALVHILKYMQQTPHLSLSLKLVP